MSNVNSPQFFIGLMSGTSADGVDVALVEINNNHIFLKDYLSNPLTRKLKHSLVELNVNSTLSLEKLCLLEKEVAEVFSSATQNILEKNHLKPQNIVAIGSHGQTIFHAPKIPMSLQIGHPAFIAKLTGITTVADFRIDDMALGGQGAPFAPAFHQKLFASHSDVFAVNIGGIANISFIPKPLSDAQLVGWDTGPGNALMDDVCQTQLNIDYDPNGINARQGKVNKLLLNTMLKHSYFERQAPKSTGRDTFQSNWLNNLLSEHTIQIGTKDLLATLCELTAISIAQQIQSINIDSSTKTPVWIVGGGAHNDYLLERIQHHLPNYSVASSLEVNFNPDAIEAMMFAWLAHERLHNTSIPLSKVTGASRDAVLGGIWHP